MKNGIIETLRNNEKLRELVILIQKLNEDKSININEAIYNLKLPLNYHLYIMGNFSDLMNVVFK